ncbi:MAG: hypothetical protein JSW06_09190 [Thermoplasmatales archaeon]|nr:MAG: hypothetical protein JSW06_09190 [Thermoplasmatales archaeon]
MICWIICCTIRCNNLLYKSAPRAGVEYANDGFVVTSSTMICCDDVKDKFPTQLSNNSTL